jgi:Xaa-Pro aminopeptidase
MRLESALAVRRVNVGVSWDDDFLVLIITDNKQTKGRFNGSVWLGFERLTCVPIQTRMVKESMLTKEEKQWLKVRFTFLFSMRGISSGADGGLSSRNITRIV